jgi:hypothetical protein
MDDILAILIGVAALWCFAKLLMRSPSQKPGGELIDPSDSRQIGMLMAMLAATSQMLPLHGLRYNALRKFMIARPPLEMSGL